MNGLTQATLILADDHPLFLKGLTEVLKTEFLILGLAANGEELLDLLKELQLKVLAGEIVFCEPKKEAQFHINRLPYHHLTDQYKLSVRELEIISLIKKGLTSNEIANDLFISINTVEAHRKHIFKKLQLKNIQGLLEFAHKYSL